MSKITRVTYWYSAASNEGIHGHAQEAMKGLGVTWLHSTPQSLGECWWFYGCSGLPDPLPDYLSVTSVDPYGSSECLDAGMADQLIQWERGK